MSFYFSKQEGNKKKHDICIFNIFISQNIYSLYSFRKNANNNKKQRIVFIARVYRGNNYFLKYFLFKNIYKKLFLISTYQNNIKKLNLK